MIAAGLEVTADGRLEVTERTVEVAANGDGAAALLELRNLVKEYPITAGLLQRKVAQRQGGVGRVLLGAGRDHVRPGRRVRLR